MTLDPTIEARVRAKRAAPLEQDADELALLDEVERLRDALADEHAGRCGDQLDLVGALALLAEQTARAERAEAARGSDPTARSVLDAEYFVMRAERDQAIAACAEMRAALLDWHGPPNPAHSVEHCPTCALLARPDLGAGVVVVPRESIDEWRDLIIDLVFDLDANSRAKRAIAELDALLKKGGG